VTAEEAATRRSTASPSANLERHQEHRTWPAGASPMTNARARVVIEAVTPLVDGGRFPIKREVGEVVAVEADVFADGHDVVAGQLLVWRPCSAHPHASALHPLGNDRWRASFTADEIGRWRFAIEAWIDHLATWRRGSAIKAEAGLDISVELEAGARLLDEAAAETEGERDVLLGWSDRVRACVGDVATSLLVEPELIEVIERLSPRRHVQRTEDYGVVVDPRLARFSAWYEIFPRSAGAPGEHGTFASVEGRLDEIAEMGFDVLYLPPVHPIGRVNRKGPNNTLAAADDDPGSPWAIGSAEGGHDAIHPRLGTEEDLRRLVTAARRRRIEIALDIAWQCAPDHPWVAEHPSWFRWRPDGEVQYAENPPKKYQDIYPLEFETPDWQALWAELARVVRHWIGVGVRIFRVDNPHTKPFAFWEWLITDIKAEHPDVLFLSEAFTRPKVMHRLAKLGFSQSYTYFTWRNTAWELREYFTELTSDPGRQYFRPNVWPNTPDILTEYLQHGGRPAFVNRLVLATTLAASYGIYGPAFELCEAEPREPGSEEYLHSEKYEIRHWDREAPHSLRPLIARLNGIRRAHPALQHDRNLVFHDVDNDQLLCASKATDSSDDVILVVVNVDPHHAQSGWLALDLHALGLDDAPFVVDDLLCGGSYEWQGPHPFVHLDPWATPAHVFQVRRAPR
jgi:starch synthase (maltosyl-transferring)